MRATNKTAAVTVAAVLSLGGAAYACTDSGRAFGIWGHGKPSVTPPPWSHGGNGNGHDQGWGQGRGHDGGHGHGH
jgi:hypothetical protein